MSRFLILSLYLILVTGCATKPLGNKYDSISGKTHAGQKITFIAKNSKAIVVAFLSAKCPCSNSNIVVLNDLAKKYKDFDFVGVHSNADEDLALGKKYFAGKKLSFPVIFDQDSSIAKKFGALKTPHIFIVSPEGNIIYNGSITSSTNAKMAKEIYLDIALSEIVAGQMPSAPRKKTLGCYIKLKS